MIDSFVRVNGVRLHYVERGNGPPVVLLHGFPDFWYTWRRQLPALSAAGFRAIALDLRGYNLSDRPPDVSDYNVDTLLGDVIAFTESVADSRTALIGHDWGGILAWYAAAARPDLFDRLVLINAPHPVRYSELLRAATPQLLRSWYVAVFQLPWLPERLLHALLAARVRKGPRPGSRDDGGRTKEELQRYSDAFDSPAAFRGPLNYYRAAMRSLLRGRRRLTARVAVPTLLLWGDRDPYLDLRNTAQLDRWVSDLRPLRMPDAGHWPHLDHAEHVNSALLAFLRETSA